MMKVLISVRETMERALCIGGDLNVLCYPIEKELDNRGVF